MKIFSSVLLDYSLFYGIILFCSFVFLFAVFEIYFDRKKNLWNLSGPFPLPLFGRNFIFSIQCKWHLFLGNALLLAGPPEQFIQTLKTVSDKYGQVGRIHIGTRPNVYVASCPEAYEKILSSNKQITKVHNILFTYLLT